MDGGEVWGGREDILPEGEDKTCEKVCPKKAVTKAKPTRKKKR